MGECQGGRGKRQPTYMSATTGVTAALSHQKTLVGRVISQSIEYGEVDEGHLFAAFFALSGIPGGCYNGMAAAVHRRKRYLIT